MNINIPKSSKYKTGFTLIELVVSMAIFLTITTLTVGAFVAVTKYKSLTSRMKDTQQKVRIATETVNRFARQAEYVKTDSGSSNYVEMLFNVSDGDTTNDSGVRLRFWDRGANGYSLFLSNCEDTDLSDKNCDNWGDPVDLLGKDLAVNINSSNFLKQGGVDSLLLFSLEVSTPGSVVNPYYSDLVTIYTSVVLESLK